MERAHGARAYHPITLQSVYNITAALFQQGTTDWYLYTWLLPRFAAKWGYGHPDLQALVQQAAIYLYKSQDPREHLNFGRVVADVAEMLPDGLGWGTTTTLPVDEEAYNRHCVMLTKASVLSNTRECLPLAKEMLTRCVAYFDSVGPHWLCSPRKVCALKLLAICTGNEEGPAAAQPLLADAKRVAQRELGANHEATLDVAWQVRRVCACVSVLVVVQKAKGMACHAWVSLHVVVCHLDS